MKTLSFLSFNVLKLTIIIEEQKWMNAYKQHLTEVLNLLPYLVRVLALVLQVLKHKRQRPLTPGSPHLLIIILHKRIILILLIQRIISQMHKIILNIVVRRGLILHGTEPRHSFLTYVSCIWPKTSYKHIDPEIKFIPFDELWPRDIFLDNVFVPGQRNFFLPFEEENTIPLITNGRFRDVNLLLVIFEEFHHDVIVFW